jgi:hypothetical protein
MYHNCNNYKNSNEDIEFDFLYEGSISYNIDCDNIISIHVPKNEEITTFQTWKDKNTPVNNREIFKRKFNRRDIIRMLKEEYTPTSMLVLSINNKIERLLFTMIFVKEETNYYELKGLLNLNTNLAASPFFPRNYNCNNCLLWVDALNEPPRGWRPNQHDTVGGFGSGASDAVDVAETAEVMAGSGCTVQ